MAIKNLVSLAYVNPEDADGFEHSKAGILGCFEEVRHFDTDTDSAWFEEKDGPCVMPLEKAKECIEYWEAIFGIELMMIPPAFLIQEPEDAEDINQDWYEEAFSAW